MSLCAVVRSLTGPPIRANFELWLASDNFDKDGRQLTSLSAANRALSQT